VFEGHTNWAGKDETLLGGIAMGVRLEGDEMGNVSGILHRSANSEGGPWEKVSGSRGLEREIKHQRGLIWKKMAKG